MSEEVFLAKYAKQHSAQLKKMGLHTQKKAHWDHSTYIIKNKLLFLQNAKEIPDKLILFY